MWSLHLSFRIEGMAPMSSVVENLLAGIIMGPVYALAMATVTAFIRYDNSKRSPPLASYRSNFGALLAGLFYKYGRKFHYSALGELWEQVLLVLLFPILLWYSLQDRLLSLAGLSTLPRFSEQP